MSEAFEECNFKVDRLDVFLQKHIDSVRSLSILWDLLREILILSNGQATVERGFSVNRQVMTTLRALEGLVSWWLAGNFHFASV